MSRIRRSRPLSIMFRPIAGSEPVPDELASTFCLALKRIQYRPELIYCCFVETSLVIALPRARAYPTTSSLRHEGIRTAQLPIAMLSKWAQTRVGMVGFPAVCMPPALSNRTA